MIDEEFSDFFVDFEIVDVMLCDFSKCCFSGAVRLASESLQISYATETIDLIRTICIVVLKYSPAFGEMLHNYLASTKS